MGSWQTVNVHKLVDNPRVKHTRFKLWNCVRHIFICAPFAFSLPSSNNGLLSKLPVAENDSQSDCCSREHSHLEKAWVLAQRSVWHFCATRMHLVVVDSGVDEMGLPGLTGLMQARRETAQTSRRHINNGWAFWEPLAIGNEMGVRQVAGACLESALTLPPTTSPTPSPLLTQSLCREFFSRVNNP